jgi:hydrogenase expression/formation protein HypC
MCLGIPGCIVAISDPARKLAIIDICGVRREVSVACIARPDEALDLLVGTWSLIHAGFAMSRIDAAEAAKTLEVLAQLGEAQHEIEALRLAASHS